MLQMLHKCPDRIKQKNYVLNYKSFLCKIFGEKKTEKTKQKNKPDIHTSWKKKKQCLMQWQARCEKPPNATEFFCTLNHLQKWEKEKRKKKSVINLYIQIQLGSKPKLHYLMLYTCISPFIFKVKPSLSPQQKKNFFRKYYFKTLNKPKINKREERGGYYSGVKTSYADHKMAIKTNSIPLNDFNNLQ